MASKRRLRRNACLGKRRYPDQESARQDVLFVNRRKGHQKSLAAYRCPFCKWFHIGRRKKKYDEADK